MTVIPFIEINGNVIIDGVLVAKTFLEPERPLTTEEKETLIYTYGDQYYFVGEEQVVADLIASIPVDPPQRTTASLSQDEPVSTTTVLKPTGLILDVKANERYDFVFNVLFQSNTATTGIRLGLSVPANSYYSATAKILSGTDGTAAEFSGALTTGSDAVVSTQVPSINITYIAEIKGTIMPTVDDVIMVQFGSEVAVGQVTIKAGSNGKLL